MCVTVNVSVQPSSYSCPMDISPSDWRWGNMCAVLALVDNKGLKLSSALFFPEQGFHIGGLLTVFAVY